MIHYRVMHFTQTNDHTFVVVLDQHEPVMQTLTDFCREQKITNGHFSGIGAVESVTCGYYDLPEREYHFTDYNELVEVVSFTGNIITKDDLPFIHAHGIFTNSENQPFGGHVQEMQVGVTLEIVLHRLTTKLYRSYDENTGLYLIDSHSINSD